MKEGVKVGSTYHITIDSLAPTGEGVGRHEGQVIFVPKSVPGQILAVQITHRKKKISFGRAEKIIHQSPDFVPPFDPEFSDHGGAPWQNTSYPVQLQWKSQNVREAFVRIGKKQNPPIEEIVPSSSLHRYRNKMEFSFGYSSMRVTTHTDGTKKYHDTNPGLGLHRSGNWKEIVRITDTLLASERIIEIMRTIEGFALGGRKQVYNPLSRQGFWRQVTLRESQRTDQVLISIQVFSQESQEFWNPLILLLQKKFPAIVGIEIVVFSGISVANSTTPRYMLFGKNTYTEKFCSLEYEISADAFFQIHTESAEKLVESIIEYADFQGTEEVLDLFCGTGTLGLAVANSVASVTGIEMVPSAIENAKQNAVRNTLTNTSFYAGKVEDVFETVTNGKYFDTVIVDPPRSGLCKKAQKILANIPAKKMVFISCNPVTLARDIMFLEENNWEVQRIRPHDLFPHTPHTEVVSLLVRKENKTQLNIPVQTERDTP